MGWTITKAAANAFRVRYKIAADSTGFSDVIITASGAASPDLITDSPPGSPLRTFFEGLTAVPVGGALDAVFGNGEISVQAQSVTESDEKLVSSPSFDLVTYDDGAGHVEFLASVDVTNTRGYVDFLFHHTLPG